MPRPEVWGGYEAAGISRCPWWCGSLAKTEHAQQRERLRRIGILLPLPQMIRHHKLAFKVSCRSIADIGRKAAIKVGCQDNRWTGAPFSDCFLPASYCALRLTPHLKNYRQVSGLFESCKKTVTYRSHRFLKWAALVPSAATFLILGN
jgi:hypothetical protein